MKKLLLPLILIFIFYGCEPEPEFLTAEQIEKEKQAVVDVMKDYNKANEEKNFSAMVETLADEVTFFGTDSAEVIKTFAEFKKAMMDQWQHYDVMKYGEMSDVSIKMDANATFASVIFGMPLHIQKGDRSANVFLRVARTLEKQKGKWVITGGIVGIARSSETNGIFHAEQGIEEKADEENEQASGQ
ncbi:MAG: nuclear transport factor 2 family protein [Candidatus Kapaibacterium sp.]